MDMGGEDWVVMGLREHVCTPELTEDTQHLPSSQEALHSGVSLLG